MKTLLLAACTLACPSATAQDTSNTQPAPRHRDASWKMVWHDEFDGSGPFDANTWETEKGFVRNEEPQWYQAENTYRQDGLLVLEAKKDSIPNPNYDADSRDWRRNRPYARYSSGSVTTRKSYSFLYGQLEVRARIPAATGSWPAIWTLGVSQGWPACGECDLMEYYVVDGKPSILANACWAGPRRQSKWDSSHTNMTHFTERDSEWNTKFHVWLMDWTPDYIRLYLDGELLNEIDLSQTINAPSRGRNGEEAAPFNPFRQPHYILLDHAVDTRATASPDCLPMRYEVDYVRVWQPQAE